MPSLGDHLTYRRAGPLRVVSVGQEVVLEEEGVNARRRVLLILMLKWRYVL